MINLPYRKAAHNVLPILQQTVLYAPFVIEKNSAAIGDEPQHLRKASSLPSNVVLMRHAIVVMAVSMLQCRVGPLSASTILHAIAGRIFQIVRWRRDHEIDCGVRNSLALQKEHLRR